MLGDTASPVDSTNPESDAIWRKNTRSVVRKETCKNKLVKLLVQPNIVSNELARVMQRMRELARQNPNTNFCLMLDIDETLAIYTTREKLLEFQHYLQAKNADPSFTIDDRETTTAYWNLYKHHHKQCPYAARRVQELCQDILNGIRNVEQKSAPAALDYSELNNLMVTVVSNGSYSREELNQLIAVPHLSIAEQITKEQKTTNTDYLIKVHTILKTNYQTTQIQKITQLQDLLNEHISNNIFNTSNPFVQTFQTLLNNFAQSPTEYTDKLRQAARNMVYEKYTRLAGLVENRWPINASSDNTVHVYAIDDKTLPWLKGGNLKLAQQYHSTEEADTELSPPECAGATTCLPAAYNSPKS